MHALELQVRLREVGVGGEGQHSIACWGASLDRRGVEGRLVRDKRVRWSHHYPNVSTRHVATQTVMWDGR
eukprot:1944416-Rhodomonas_salina.4